MQSFFKKYKFAFFALLTLLFLGAFVYGGLFFSSLKLAHIATPMDYLRGDEKEKYTIKQSMLIDFRKRKEDLMK